MNSKAELVDYQESLSIRIGRFLLSKGFDLADNLGVAVPSLDTCNQLGILRKNPEAKRRTYLFGLIKPRQRRMFLGQIKFDNARLEATEQNWVIEVYGRLNVELVRQLAEEMASAFNVRITVSLVREDATFEIYYGEI